MTSVPHFLYRFLDGKKTTRFQFSIPGLREIHRNLKQQKIFKSHESFFRKSPFCSFSCINPRFGRPCHIWSVAKVVGCAKQSKNLKGYLIFMHCYVTNMKNIHSETGTYLLFFSKQNPYHSHILHIHIYSVNSVDT